MTHDMRQRKQKIRMESTTTITRPRATKHNEQSQYMQQGHSPPHLETQIGDGLGLDSIEVHTLPRTAGGRQCVENSVDGAPRGRLRVPRGPKEEDGLLAGGRSAGEVRYGHGCEGQKSKSWRVPTTSSTSRYMYAWSF